MPPADPQPNISSADTQRLPSVVVQSDPNHIPQWAVKGLLAILALIVIPGTIAVVSYVFGGIHSRLTENEKAIRELEKEDVRVDTRLKIAEQATRKQWELLSVNKEKLGTHKH